MLNNEVLKDILNVISSNRLINDRINKLKEKGYNVTELAMGSGGVGQVQKLKSEFRIQIGYGHGRCNYAYCVIIKKRTL